MVCTNLLPQVPPGLLGRLTGLLKPRATAGAWGIEMGQCALKALRLEKVEGGLVATAFDYVEHPKILSQPDADADQLSREALDKFLSRNTLRGDSVAVSVPGRSGLARFVKLPPVEEKKIPDTIRFEAKQQIPFNLEEVVWDYYRIGSPPVTDGFTMDAEFGLFAARRDILDKTVRPFKEARVPVNIVQLAPLALCNFLAYDQLDRGEGDESRHGKGRCLAVLDVGTEDTTLVITNADRVLWLRQVPLGGNHFTRALAKDLKFTFAKSEHLKRNAVKSPDLKKILMALKPVLNELVGEVQQALGYFVEWQPGARIDSALGVGNSFHLPGLQRFLSEKL
jgi:type IV pilus assembly protein PilM